MISSLLNLADTMLWSGGAVDYAVSDISIFGTTTQELPHACRTGGKVNLIFDD